MQGAGSVLACVLGATGFIGGGVARAALEQGIQVRALRRRDGAVGALADIAHQISWVSGNIKDHRSMVNAMHGCDWVFHTAGYYISSYAPIPSHIDNARTQMTQVLNAFQESNARRLIYTSSLTTVGSPTEEGQLADEKCFYVAGSEPRNSYYESKSAMEQLALEAANAGQNIVITNPTMTFGPGDVKAFTGSLLLMALKGQLLIRLPGMLNFGDIRDVARGHLAAAEKLPAGERVILGGRNHKVADVMSEVIKIARQLGAPWRPNPPVIPQAVVESVGRILTRIPFFMLQDHMTTLHLWQPLNLDKMHNLLGIYPRDFNSAIRDGLEWYIANGYLN